MFMKCEAAQSRCCGSFHHYVSPGFPKKEEEGEEKQKKAPCERQTFVDGEKKNRILFGVRGGLQGWMEADDWLWPPLKGSECRWRRRSAAVTLHTHYRAILLAGA